MGKQITQMDHILTRCLKTIEDLGWTVEDCLQRHAPLRQELEPMLRAALALRQGRSVKPPTVFQKTARSRLQLRLQASNRPPVPQAEKSTRILFRKWKFGAVHIITIIAVVLSTAFGGAIYAADASGPGDTLHNVDLAVENFRVKLTTRDSSLAKLQLKLASERLKEAEHELEGRANPENVSVALVAFDQIIAELETLVAKGDLTPEQRVETKEVITALQDAKQSSSVDMDGDAEIEKEEEGGSVDTGGEDTGGSETGGSEIADEGNGDAETGDSNTGAEDTDSTETDGADTGGSETGGEDSNEQPSEDGEDTGDSETEGADTNGSETADEHNDSDGSEHNGADTDSSETGGEDGSDSGGDGENDRDKSDD